MKPLDTTASSSLQLFEPATDVVYSIETVVRLTQTPRHLIAVYCRHGLIAPVAPPELHGWWFDHEAIRRLRQVARLRSEYGMNLRGVQLLAGLMDQVELLQAEIWLLDHCSPQGAWSVCAAAEQTGNGNPEDTRSWSARGAPVEVTE